MGKTFLEITGLEEAERIVARTAAALAQRRTQVVETVSITEALGRVAAIEIVAALDVPPFDRATMDGYAVVAADTFYADEDHPALLRLRSSVAAGEVPLHSVERGTCMGIATGAPLPRGADAVVQVEYTAEYTELVDGEERRMVKVYKPVAPGEHLMLAGSDIKRGERIVDRGTRLTPRETGVLAACGITEVLVYKKPIVAIISTGNELIAPGEELLPAKIYDVNAQALSDSVRECGCIPLLRGIVRDNRDEMVEELKGSIELGAEVIITSGGTSAGVGDLLPGVIGAEGEIFVHGVDIKPGKPFIFGMLHGRPIFGLPGNPTSALITFNLFVAPLLHILAGLTPAGAELKRKRVQAKAGVRIFSELGRNEYVLVKLLPAPEPEGVPFLAYPLLSGSGAITTLARADGYIFMEKGKEITEEGELVEVELLSDLPRLTLYNRKP